MEQVDQIMQGSQSASISRNCPPMEKRPAECSRENVVHIQGIKRKDQKGSSNKRKRGGLETSKTKGGKRGKAKVDKNTGSAPVSSEAVPGCVGSTNFSAPQVFQHNTYPPQQI